MPRIRIEEGRRSRLVELLPRSSIMIGRGQTNEVVLEDVAASREHCTLERRGDDWWITDLQSRNGTKLNGQKVASPTRLRPGDRVEIGLARITFVTDESDMGLEESTGLNTFARSLGPNVSSASDVGVVPGLVSTTPLEEAASAILTAVDEGQPLMKVLDAVERAVLARVLERSNGNRSEAARRLSLSRPGLLKKMKRLRLK
jgi:pSer/pThr/pTyr-binding forkhead associated (FHA) protein